MVQAAQIIDYEDWGTTVPKGTFSNPFSVENLIDEDTGIQVNDVDWLTSVHRQEEIKTQTQDACDVLSRFNVKTSVENNIYFKGLVTGVVSQPIKYRNINFLMAVAQQNRKEQQNALGLFLDKYENRHARYLTVASGERIPVGGDLAGRMEGFSRKISRFAWECDHDWDVDVFCRVFEMPYSDGSLHLHANIVYQPRGRMSPKKWEAFLKFIRDTFGHGSKDNGIIRDLNEIIKYMMKGDDVEQLIKDDPAALLWLYESTFNKRIFSAFGEFRELRRSLKEDGKKVIRRKEKYVVVRKKSLKAADDNTYAADDLEPTGDRTNEFLAVSTPYFHTSPYKEPVAVIRNLKAFGVSNQPLGTYADLMVDLQEWEERAKDAWARNTDQTPEQAVKYAKMLRETQDVNKVEVLSRHRKKADAKAQAYANERFLKQKSKDFAAGKSISVHTSTITVLETDRQRAEKEIIKHQRRVSSIKMLKNLDTGDPPDHDLTRNTSENTHSFLKVFFEEGEE